MDTHGTIHLPPWMQSVTIKSYLDWRDYVQQWTAIIVLFRIIFKSYYKAAQETAVWHVTHVTDGWETNNNICNKLNAIYFCSFMFTLGWGFETSVSLIWLILHTTWYMRLRLPAAFLVCISLLRNFPCFIVCFE